jgi:hypothetical protein
LLRNHAAQGKTSGESDSSPRNDEERNYEDEDRGLEMDSDDGRGGGGGDGHTVIAPGAMHIEETSGDYEPEAHFDPSSRRPGLPGLGCTPAQAMALRLSTVDRVDEEEEEWQAKYEADWRAKWVAPAAGVDGAVDAGGNGVDGGAGGGRGGGVGGHTQGQSEYESSVDASYFAGLSPEDYDYPWVANGGGGHAESSQHESDMERGVQDKRGAEEEESNNSEEERDDDEEEEEDAAYSEHDNAGFEMDPEDYESGLGGEVDGDEVRTGTNSEDDPQMEDSDMEPCKRYYRAREGPNYEQQRTSSMSKDSTESSDSDYDDPDLAVINYFNSLSIFS